MDRQVKEQMKKRCKSLAWRAGTMAVVVVLNGLLTMLNDGTIIIPQTYAIFLGLIVGETTKYLNRAR